MNKRKFILALLVLGFFLLPILTSAQTFNYKPLEKIPGFESQTTGDFYTYIGAVYKFGIWVVGICALLMIVLGGYMYIMSAGNTAGMDKAKGIITDAILGLILALASYLILYQINPALVQLHAPSAMTGGAPAAAPAAAPKGALATGCNNYDSAFSSASGGDKNLKCLLIAIANAESNCNPNLTSPQNACGLMQILPGTAGKSCAELLNDPNGSIQLAANYIGQAQSSIPSSSGFDVGRNHNLSGAYVAYGNYKYDTGNDDLIASYNAGYGTGASTPGLKGPFVISSDCPNPVTPAWQCNINPGGFSATQSYVMQVQSLQASCLAK